LALYLHFPFCVRKCAYCDFASQPLEAAGGLPVARRYLDALAIETDLRAMSEEFYRAPVETAYIGGGTPTVLPSDWIGEVMTRLLRRFPLDPEAEITIEANPGTVDEAKLSSLLAAGINRLSLGVQSFADPVLGRLGRIHSAAEARQALAAARRAGFSSVSLDLIYGIPLQTLDEWSDSITAALEARPDHLSLYALTLEPGTPMEAAVACAELPAPDDDLTADMYALAEEALGRAGFEHYEISNYALPGRQCRHNRIYWDNGEYLGLGLSSWSYRRGIRWNNSPDLGVYCDWLERGRLPVLRAEALSARARVGEALMLGLRRAEGVSEGVIADRCGLAPREVFGDEIGRLCEQGLLIAEEGRLRLPRDMWLLSNEVLSQFVI